MSAEQQPALIRETFPVGPLQCNCTIIGDPLTKKAIVVDPPLSSAIPVTAPRRTSACASSKFVRPTL